MSFYKPCDPLKKKRLHESTQEFSLYLYNIPNLPRKCVDEIILKVDSLVSEDYLPCLMDTIQQNMKDCIDDMSLGKITCILNDNKNPFSGLKTEHDRFKNYTESNLFSYPMEVKLGEKIDTTYEEDGNKKEITNKSYAVYIPMEKSLKILLEMPGVFDAMATYKKRLLTEDFNLRNIVQGKLWQTKYSKEENVYPLFIFFDDFETGNPLGSHAGKQKFGGVYASLPCLPPHLVAKLCNHFLVCLFHSEDRIKYGNEITFREVINDLNKLSKQGMIIEKDGIPVVVYFYCVLVLGDNLGLNCVCGFSESFSASYYCRICRASNEQCHILTKQVDKLMRNRINYENDLKIESIGISQRCVFNSLENFHITENRSLDIMHDIFEGAARYTLEKVFDAVIKNEGITIVDINERIRNFQYGPFESSKPCQLKWERCTDSSTSWKVSVKQSAAEMVCLMICLGPMIGDMISVNKKYWKIYKALRKIIGILLRPSIRTFHMDKLKEYIEEFAGRYIQCFGNLVPKIHFMTHIPTILEDNGPLVHFWVMTDERKNRELKIYSKSTSSSKNLALTIAIKNQLKLAYLKKCTKSKPEEITYGPSKVCDVKDIIRIAPNMSGVKTARSYSFIEVYGYRFESNVICVQMTEVDPSFFQLETIYEINGVLYFSGISYTYIRFHHHYHVHEVSSNGIVDTLLPMSEISMVPPPLIINKNGNFNICTRYD